MDKYVDDEGEIEMKASLFRILSVGAASILCMSMLVGCTQDVSEKDISVSVKSSSGTSDKTGKFTGTLDDKQPDGTGKIVFDDGWTYSGIFNSGKLGKGTAKNLKLKVTVNGTEYTGIYNGSVSGELPEGQGIFDSKDGNKTFKYDGNWKGGKVSGAGKVESNNFTIHFKDADSVGTYSGSVVDGKPSGKGEFTALDKDNDNYTYTGEWTNGLCNGTGTCKYKDAKFEVKTGNFKDGEFLPTVSQYFAACGTGSNCKYEMSDTAEKFMNSHEKLFTDHNKANINKALSNGYSFAQYSKSPKSFDGKLTKISGLTVVQIQEDTYWGADRTFMIASSGEQVYYINYIGKTNVITGDTITAYVMPLNYFTYKNTDNNDVWAVACAGALIEK